MSDGRGLVGGFRPVDLSAWSDVGEVPTRGFVTNVQHQRGRAMPRAVAVNALKASGVNPRALKLLGVPTAAAPKGLARPRVDQVVKAAELVERRAGREPVAPTVGRKPAPEKREAKNHDGCKARPKKPARGGSGSKRREFIPWCR